MLKSREALIGKRYGKLTIVGIEKDATLMKDVILRCMCDCGEIELRSRYGFGKNSMCNKCRKIQCSINNSKHGMSNTRIHRIWSGMITRTTYTNDDRYKNYGGRGITVCKEWTGNNGFVNFYNWAIKNNYSDELSIDRIDVDGNYEPSNCRWITMFEQQANKRNTRRLTIDNVTHHLSEWCRIVNIRETTVNRRLKEGWSDHDAIMTPITDISATLQSTIEGVTWNTSRDRWKCMGKGNVFVGWYHTEQKATYAKIWYEKTGEKIHNSDICVKMLEDLDKMILEYDNTSYFDRGKKEA